MSENNITSLDSTSFRGMRMMRRLYFNHNQITTIGRRTFDSVQRQVMNKEIIILAGVERVIYIKFSIN